MATHRHPNAHPEPNASPDPNASPSPNPPPPQPGRQPRHRSPERPTGLRLGIDLDGVVADFNTGWTALHNAEFGGDLSPDMVTMWDGLYRLGGFDDMAAFWSWARSNDDRPSIFRHLPLIAGAAETLRTLDESGHEMVVVSSKPEWAIHETLQWIAEHRLPTREIHLTWDKSAVDCDVYLDDAPHVLHELAERRPNATICRFVRPWNDPVDGTVDVHDWTRFHEIVTRETRKRVMEQAQQQ